MFAYYCQRLSTVEINNSFYHLPSRQTFQLWRDESPAHFLFAVKASRYITHMKKLKDPERSLNKFLFNAEGLGEKLAVILFQLPPSWRCDRERLREFLCALPPDHRYAFEFRHPSWFGEGIYSLLEQHNVALCVYELAGQLSPRRLTADFAYVRLHGPSHLKYAGRYSRAQLHSWLVRCQEWLRQGAREVFIYFDNDQAGFAAMNALELAEAVRINTCS